jgi:hypothetical protein
VLKVLQIYRGDNIEAKELRIANVKEGIRSILTHFEGRQSLFPRKMSTSLSQGRQFIVYNEEQILNECIKSNFIDCRLNAYPVLSDNDIAPAIRAPNLIFIDIDLLTGNYENSILELSKTLSRSLKQINHKLEKCIPTVLWTGNGYHIYIVLDTRPLELITELTELSRQPSEEFLKFAEIIFTNGKADSKHNHSFSSYLLRIPHTFNSKCFNENADPEVKIIQRFDFQQIPKINSCMLREFRLYLADLNIKRKRDFIKQDQKIRQYNKCNNSQSVTYKIPQSYQWVETVLQSSIPDHRKFTLDLVLTPYLLNIQRISFDQAFSILRDWITRCNNLRNLQPSLHNFLDYRIMLAIDRSAQSCIPPIRIDTFKKNYPDWYKDFVQWHLFS